MTDVAKQVLGVDEHGVGGGVRVWCPGRPRTKGSLRPTHIKRGRGQCTVGLREDGEYSIPWKRAMIKAIRAACVCERYEGAVEVHAFFRFESEAVQDVADWGRVMHWPTPAQYGDEDKLRRNVLDALTQSALIHDDRLVVGGQAWKRWCQPGEDPGVLIFVKPNPDLMNVLEQEYLIGLEFS